MLASAATGGNLKWVRLEVAVKAPIRWLNQGAIGDCVECGFCYKFVPVVPFGLGCGAAPVPVITAWI